MRLEHLFLSDTYFLRCHQLCCCICRHKVKCTSNKLLAGSHWEKRLLMNEIMTGSVDTRSVVSKMTLALLEDSGWYQANYSMADRLDWGRNQGTEFVTSPCNLWKGAYHCNTTQLSGCTYNREAEGYCPIVSYSGDLPHWARYFPQANKGLFLFIVSGLI